MLLASAAAYLAALLGCFIAVPQIVLLVRTRDTTGLSIRSWQISSLSATAWFGYGVRVEDPPQILANACALAGSVIVLWLALEPGERRRSELLGFGVLAGVVACAVVTMPLPWLTAPLAATGIASRVPQLRVTAATWWHRRKSAVSVGTWVVTVAVAGLWLFYGLASRDIAIAGSSALSVSTAALILLAETSPRPLWLGQVSTQALDDVTVLPTDQPVVAVVDPGRPFVPVREPVTGDLAVV